MEGIVILRPIILLSIFSTIGCFGETMVIRDLQIISPKANMVCLNRILKSEEVTYFRKVKSEDGSTLYSVSNKEKNLDITIAYSAKNQKMITLHYGYMAGALPVIFESKYDKFMNYFKELIIAECRLPKSSLIIRTKPADNIVEYRKNEYRTE